MLDSFIAIVPFASVPAVDHAQLQQALAGLEPGAAVAVTTGPGGSLSVQLGQASGQIIFHSGQMPEEAALSSIGMADLSAADAARLHGHGGFVWIDATAADAPAMERMILLIKCGMALCAAGGWAFCVPASGLCVMACDLEQMAILNQVGPRVWGLDEAEGALPGYEPRGLWESLRRDAQPAHLLVGFVPAEVENRTWFFSAGHSTFGLPEIAYSEGSLEDFATIRELFRFLFPYFYLNPQKLQNANVVKTVDGSLTISMHDLPVRYEQLQASTGTLRVRISGNSEADSEWDD